MEVIKYLPQAFKGQLANFLDQMIPIIMLGFSDNFQGVREVALQAGQVNILILFSFLYDTMALYILGSKNCFLKEKILQGFHPPPPKKKRTTPCKKT